MGLKKACLIEIGGSHSECLYSQILFLKESNYVVELLCSSDLSKKLNLSNFKINVKYYDFGSGEVNKLKNLINLKKYIENNEFDKIIFNTASGNLIRNLLIFRFKKTVEFIGVLHDINKLTNSFTQKLISKKIKKYFVLNDYILESSKLKNSLNLESIYTIFNPQYENGRLQKGSNEFWICIPGTLQYDRRDYHTLLINLQSEEIKANVKFILLGQSSHFNSNSTDIKMRIEKLNLQDKFIFFQNYIQEDIFQDYIQNSDVIMPLIHREHPYYKEVAGFKISGTFNLAFSHKKPLLCEESFEQYQDFRENAIFYNVNNMIEVINDLASNRIRFENRITSFYKNPKWDFDYQMNKYINFIEN